MSTMRILNRTGDTALKWDVDKPEGDPTTDLLSVEEVRARFDKIVREEKRLATAVHRPASGGEVEAVVIRAFDPTAEEIVLTPQIVGG